MFIYYDLDNEVLGPAFRQYHYYYARGPATANARSPMVERRVAGTRTSAVGHQLP